ncbi:uncharacterized protein LOC102073806 [Zonotrichia albicollis]|uniref:uncharacterized protein LOC102073806 n=1 Tax=Zonotrichia albicollis TaxID=44394 RepID=UPI003D811B3F
MVLTPAPPAPGAHLRYRSAPAGEGRTAKSGQAPSRLSRFPDSPRISAAAGLGQGGSCSRPRPDRAPTGQRQRRPRHGPGSATAEPEQRRQPRAGTAPGAWPERRQRGRGRVPGAAVPGGAQLCPADRRRCSSAGAAGRGRCRVAAAEERNGAAASSSSSSPPLPRRDPAGSPRPGGGKQRAVPAVAARPEVAPHGVSPRPRPPSDKSPCRGQRGTWRLPRCGEAAELGPLPAAESPGRSNRSRSSGARPSAAVRACVKTEARLQKPPEACPRSGPLKEDQKVTFDLKEIMKMSFMSDTSGAISKLIQEESSIEGECLHRLSAEEQEEQHKHSCL